MNLSVQILVALILSVCAGLVIGPEGLPFVNKWIAPIGTIFINFIKMMIVPVVTCSLIVGVTSLGGDSKKLGRISAKTICLYLVTTAIAIVLGFAVAGIIQPGVGLDIAGKVAPKVKEAPTFMQVLVNMVPTNPVDAMAKGQILPVIIFALLVGIGITQLDEKRSRFLMDLYDAGAEVCYKIIAMVMKFAPLGVFALLLPVVCKNGPKVLLPLLSVILAVAIGCTLQCILVYSTLASTMGGVNPVKFFRGMSEAMMLAFTTCSSAAALPVNMKNCQEKLGLSREVTSFVLPLGCTINMDGTALYMGVCSLFVANAFGVNLTTSDMIMIVFTGTLASIGTAGVPGAGLIMLAMVLQAVQLPMEGLALVAGIDRVLDMFRTCVNITGDGAVCCVVDKTERKHAD
ncbi:MAG: dicarboxylate/amino acid:cation symporter [Acidaminococcaceae bacterium]|nr:dicarboxylate/amino acid:cation symporter [Acidaminococcaceae bacterium]